jgi:hypothetical protein
MMIAAVFAMQVRTLLSVQDDLLTKGVGILVAALVAVMVLACFKPLIESDSRNVDYCWRLCLVPFILSSQV